MSQSEDERCLYVTPIRLGLLSRTNQIAASKGASYVRKSLFFCISPFQRVLYISYAKDFVCGFETENRTEFVIVAYDRSLWHIPASDPALVKNGFQSSIDL